MGDTLTVDRGALDAARVHLGLTMPVRVVVVGRMTAQGRYCGVVDGAHQIRVRRQTEDPASAILWHELAHAAQRERYATEADYDDAYRRQWRAAMAPGDDWKCLTHKGYQRFESIPFEREAFELERRADRHPLFGEDR